jgi:cystathionine beta-lyase/cystathionine gamma-synthase
LVRSQSAGIEATYVDLSDPEALNGAIRPSTRLVWLETPTNPMLKVIDLDRIATIARAKRVLVACDNTFASPWTQRPLEHGFDLVMHSTTKYLNGHSDMVGGIVVVGENVGLRERMAFLQNAVGAIQGPFDSFLALRGVKTLALRMERQSASALRIAHWLAERSLMPSAARTSRGVEACVISAGNEIRLSTPPRLSANVNSRQHSRKRRASSEEPATSTEIMAPNARICRRANSC